MIVGDYNRVAFLVWSSVVSLGLPRSFELTNVFIVVAACYSKDTKATHTYFFALNRSLLYFNHEINVSPVLLEPSQRPLATSAQLCSLHKDGVSKTNQEYFPPTLPKVFTFDHIFRETSHAYLDIFTHKDVGKFTKVKYMFVKCVCVRARACQGG